MAVRSTGAIRREEVIRLLAEHRDELAREHRVKALSLFGSVARDEAGPASDIDVLVDFKPGASLLTMGGLQQYLEELLGRDVDLVSRGGIKRQIQDRILCEEVRILITAPDGSLAAVAVQDGPTAQTAGRPGQGVEMAERNWKMRVEDILEAIEAIQLYTSDLDFEAFEADPMRVNAVLYNFVVIGEAERHVPPKVEARYPSIPWAKMRGMRNVLVHDYSTVRLEIVWETARDHLPPLVPVLREILAREP